jgi:predicted RNase H-like HicB family nuclease
VKSVYHGGSERRQHVEKMIALRLEAEREDDLYVANCPALDISSYGDTVDDAFAHLKNAIALYLDTIEQDGEIERVLRERGIAIEHRLEANYNVTIHPEMFATVSRFTVGAA